MNANGGTQGRRRYQRLSAAEVSAVLTGLPGWSGDTRRLLHTVIVGDADALLEQVSAVEAELDHHAAVERAGRTVTFTLWTHLCDAVTEADVELAQQISELIARQAVED